MNIYGVVGWKNCGKTGLCERLVAEFVAQGLRVSTMKHSHHGVDLDPAGTDTHRHRVAGAQQVMLASQGRWALMTEAPKDTQPEALLKHFAPVDLVLVEGWKTASHPKIEAYRAETKQTLLAYHDRSIRAVASDAPHANLSQPVFDLNDTQAIAGFILKDLGL